MLEKYIGLEDRKVYYLVPIVGHDKDEAKRTANKIFKLSLNKLKAKVGFVYKEKLYWKQPAPGSKATWAVWKG